MVDTNRHARGCDIYVLIVFADYSKREKHNATLNRLGTYLLSGGTRSNMRKYVMSFEIDMEEGKAMLFKIYIDGMI